MLQCSRCKRRASQVVVYPNGWCRDCTRAARGPDYEARAYRRKRVKRLNDAGLKETKRCGICGGENSDGRSLHIDHDHTTGVIRGLLCFRCNASIGQFDDDPILLRKAAEYLEGSHDQ